MSKKLSWAEVDKRIRMRRTAWTADELKDLDASLKRLPDLTDQVDTVDLPQPALASGQRDSDGAN